MNRRLFNLAAALSLPLSVATAVLWVRSYFTLDYLQWTDTRHFPGVVSCGGRAIVSYQFWPNGTGGNEPGWGIGTRPRQRSIWERPDANDANTWPHSRNYLVGFEWSPTAGAFPDRPPFTGLVYPTPTTYIIAVPHWFLLALSCAPSMPLARRLWRRRRMRYGCCPRCGYDLRATPDRCPECGGVSSITAHAAA